MTLVLVTATTLEMKAVLTGFNGRGRFGCALPGEGAVLPSPINERDCLLAVTGIGPVNAALRLARLLAIAGPIAGVINLGVAGSFDTARAPLCSVVMATREVWPEYGLALAGGVDSRGLGFPLRDHETSPVWNTLDLDPADALRTMGLGLPSAAITGTSITVAGVSGTPERATQLAERHNALTENMEGFALALACRDLDIPFAEVRTISNRVGVRPPVDWNLDGALTALGAAARDMFC